MTDQEVARFGAYVELIRKWNRVHRLAGSDDPAWIFEHLILDSLLFLELVPRQAVDVADLGSGAGIPGIPLKIVRPDIHMVLIEARARRASFLSAAVRELGLEDVRVVASRAESERELVGAFDAVVARCTGPWAQVAAIVRVLLRRGGVGIIAGPPERPRADDVEWVRVEAGRRGRNFALVRHQG